MRNAEMKFSSHDGTRGSESLLGCRIFGCISGSTVFLAVRVKVRGCFGVD